MVSVLLCYRSHSDHSVAGIDYTGVVGISLAFEVGDQRVCSDIHIIDDDICETEPVEDYFASLQYVSGDQPIIIDPSNTYVIINNNAEPECGKISAIFHSYYL